MSKMHLVDADSPVERGSEQTARCKKTVTRTIPLHLWDSGDLPMLEVPRGMCKKCLEATPSASGRTFVYAVQGGDDAQ